jgi:peptidyl-prolyl cis-trans isomerase B (cyclophilin B)
MKKLWFITALSFCALTLVSCSAKPAFKNPTFNGSRTKDAVGFQFNPPAEGEEIAVVHTEKGDIKIRLFPDSAPVGVANFKKLIKDGYYNGKTFHRAEKDFCVQAGSLNGDGTGGTDAWGKSFEFEFNKNLLNFNGALSYANNGQQNSNTCQFFIVTNTKVEENQLKSYKSRLSAEAYKLYQDKGGAPFLDNGYTVFGQVFDGWDAVTAIEDAEVTDNGSGIHTLNTPVVITSAELVKFSGSIQNPPGNAPEASSEQSSSAAQESETVQS